MASKPKKTPEVQNQGVTLQEIIDATKADSFVYTPASFHEPLEAQQKVVVNREIPPDVNGNLATRAINFETDTPVTDTQTAPAETSTVSSKPSFVIEADVPIPARQPRVGGNRAGRTAVYPFAQLEIGQSFFVPNKLGTNEHGEPFPPAIKAMASTVAAANERYSEEIEGQTRVNRRKETVPATRPTRKFKIYDTERTNPDTGVVEKGARIFRVKLED